MQVVYDKLFDKLKAEGILMKTFREDLKFSGSIITRLQHNGFVTTETIGRICQYLNCTPNDIMDILFDGTSYEDYTKQKQIAALEKQLADLKGGKS